MSLVHARKNSHAAAPNSSKPLTRATIGNIVELELQAIRNPVMQAELHPEVVLLEGLVTKHGNVAASKVFRVQGGVQYDHSGQYAAFGPFEYS